jgi:hypothetical protein
MEFDELVSTREFVEQASSNYRRLCISGDEITANKLVTNYEK